MQIESNNSGTYRVRYMNTGVTPAPAPRTKPSDPGAFGSILNKQLNETDSVRFSAHAQRRMNSREINLSDQDMARLSSAVDKAASKGARDSLVLLNNLAFVVNIPQRTVITAIDDHSMREHIFTNIDSAVLA